MMNRKTLEEVKALLSEVDDLVTEAIIDLDLKNELDFRGFKLETPNPPRPSDIVSGGNMTTGALRRRSMDLTRKLSELRRSV